MSTQAGHPLTTIVRATLRALAVLALSAWMAVWGLVSFIGIPLGADGICADGGSGVACGSAFLPSWLALMAVEVLAVLGAVALLVPPGRRAWGVLLGVLGTGGVAIAYSLALGLPLT